MLGLGIESTAHTFSCAVLEKKGKKGKILSDVRKIYRPPSGEGIHPREASRHHIENSANVLSECLTDAGITIRDVDIISYAAGPGLGEGRPVAEAGDGPAEARREPGPGPHSAVPGSDECSDRDAGPLPLGVYGTRRRPDPGAAVGRRRGGRRR